MRECQKAEMYFKLINKLHKKHLPCSWKSFLSYKVDYCQLIPSPSCESTLTKLNNIWDQITRDPEWVEALRKHKIV